MTTDVTAVQTEKNGNSLAKTSYSAANPLAPNRLSEIFYLTITDLSLITNSETRFRSIPTFTTNTYATLWAIRFAALFHLKLTH